MEDIEKVEVPKLTEHRISPNGKLFERIFEYYSAAMSDGTLDSAEKIGRQNLQDLLRKGAKLDSQKKQDSPRSIPACSSIHQLQPECDGR